MNWAGISFMLFGVVSIAIAAILTHLDDNRRAIQRAELDQLAERYRWLWEGGK